MDFNAPLDQLESLGCEFAFYFHATGQEPFFRGNCDRFTSASVIKVPILLSWAVLERHGAVDRDEICNLDDEPVVYGSGFARMFHIRRLPFHDVLLMMIATSDNYCTNLIIHRIGLERMAQVFKDEVGLNGTVLQRRLMDMEGKARGLDNWLSARDCIRMFDLVRRLEPAQRVWVDEMLAACVDNSLLLRDNPDLDLDFKHKTGYVTGVRHDWGYTDKTDIFLLTQNLADPSRAFPIFGQLGRAISEVD